MAGLEAAGTVKSDQITIRKIHDLEEIQACVRLQQEVWRFPDAELVPMRVFVVANKIGGQVIGAFAGQEMIGFCLAIPGVRGGHSYLHSHMLGVRESYRDAGIGRRIKLFQREDALARGFELIEWTFDPLEIKNAFLNLERLGAIARRYYINQYGFFSSPLQGGLPTDRLVAEWWLRSKRVQAVVNGGAPPPFVAEASVEVPGQIYAWKASLPDRAKAAQVQIRNRERFLRAFSQGMACLGLQRDDEGTGRFLLGRWDESWSYATEVHL
jgi:predicted GNAT superfamily acetyltransferase